MLEPTSENPKSIRIRIQNDPDTDTIQFPGDIVHRNEKTFTSQK